MYDELVKRLREMGEWSNIKWEDYSDDAQETMREASDAIEELSVVVRAQKAVIDKLIQQLRVEIENGVMT